MDRKYAPSVARFVDQQTWLEAEATRIVLTYNEAEWGHDIVSDKNDFAHYMRNCDPSKVDVALVDLTDRFGEDDELNGLGIEFFIDGDDWNEHMDTLWDERQSISR